LSEAIGGGIEAYFREIQGKRIAIGTHGNVMTLMMNYFDPMYDLEFLNRTSKPDIYKMEFKVSVLKEVVSSQTMERKNDIATSKGGPSYVNSVWQKEDRYCLESY
jgi:broad specificity phosphatase PhoE